MVSAIGGASSFSFAALKQTQQNPQERFSASDTDGSSGLSLEEYANFAPDFIQDIEGSFTQIDSDGSGDLTDAELESFAESQGGRPPRGGPPPGGGGPGGAGAAATNSIIQELLAEAAESDEDFFNALDVNEDGTVSSEELQSGEDQLISSFLNTLLAAQEDSLAA